MKTTLDLPDDLVRAVKSRAVEENRQLQDTIADLLRRGLAKGGSSPMPGRRRLKLPLVDCAHEARPGEEMTPERVSAALLDEEATPTFNYAGSRHDSCTSVVRNRTNRRKEPIMPETATETSLIGKTIRWIFDDGATGGGAYEHTFNADGSVEFRKLDESKDSPGGSAGGKTTREKKYGSFEVAPGVTLVSYLGSSGYTLTIAMNFETGTIHGFASNDKEWHPVSGKLEIVK